MTGTRWTAARDGPAAGRDAPFWDALDDGERAALRRVARPRRYPPGAPLCFQGADSDHLVVIQSGWAKVTSSGQDGREGVRAVQGPGELVCESAVLGGRERSATVTALGPVRALVVPAARFTGFLDAHPGVWRLVSGTFVRRLFLSEALDTENMRAFYDDGVLTLTIPTAEEAKPRKVLVGSKAAQIEQ